MTSSADPLLEPDETVVGVIEPTVHLIEAGVYAVETLVDLSELSRVFVEVVEQARLERLELAVGDGVVGHDWQMVLLPAQFPFPRMTLRIPPVGSGTSPA